MTYGGSDDGSITDEIREAEGAIVNGEAGRLLSPYTGFTINVSKCEQV